METNFCARIAWKMRLLMIGLVFALADVRSAHAVIVEGSFYDDLEAPDESPTDGPIEISASPDLSPELLSLPKFQDAGEDSQPATDTAEE